MSIVIDDIVAARARIAGQVRTTPCELSQTLSNLTGAQVWLKFENLQFTSSFKERGALNSLLQMDAATRAAGVIAVSAGNHAQAVAYHGQRLDVPTTIVMPRSTPNAKVEQSRVFGATVLLEGDDLEQARLFTMDLAATKRLTLLHPFDDPRVIAGQGTLGLELLEQLDAFDDLVVPVGGGGLMAGVALAVKSARPDVRITGVQVSRFDAAVQEHNGIENPQIKAGNTIAEGIAVKSPGGYTRPLLNAHVDHFLAVDESAIEEAVFLLLEIEKTVTEGAGAAGLAALFANKDRYRGRRVVVVLTGGNVDMLILSSILRRGMVRSHRLARLEVEIPDLPGSLSELTRLVGDSGCNIVELEHQRAFAGSSVRTTQIELEVQLRDQAQLAALLVLLKKAGYQAAPVSDL